MLNQTNKEQKRNINCAYLSYNALIIVRGYATRGLLLNTNSLI